jgi:phage antirepressor YoqD-like protein
MKQYCVVYLSQSGIHYRYRCSDKNKTEAKKMCREYMGVKTSDIVEVYEE